MSNASARSSFAAGFLRTFIAPAVILAILYQAIVAAFGKNDYYMYVLTLSCMNVILATSLNLINGFTGQFSLGHAGFMAVGAYLAGSLTKFTHWPFVPALVVGAIGASLAGVLVGLPTLRLRGDYLAIATLGFGEIIRMLIIASDQIGLKFLEGPRGVMGITKYTSFGWAYLLAGISVWVLTNFIWSTHGRACVSVREDEVAAEAMGVNTTRYKVMAFCIGAGFAGLAGGLHAHFLQLLHPSSYDFLKSVDYLVMVVVGGMGSLTGCAVAAVFLTVFNEVLRRALELRMLIYAICLVIIMLTRPQGLLGGKEISLGAFKYLVPSYGRSRAGSGERGLT
ncbi:MAG: branched-chain amino acid ABC transporter permease [Firmicutes bacterium]|jgi:branched-chain amino acid transport system permease protein|nr:branched-chain amino acid ABC transporter permease [Bacillota bacterium]